MPRFFGLTIALVAGAVLLSGCAGPAGPDASPVPPAQLVTGVDCLAPNLADQAAPITPTPTDDPAHPDAPAPGRVPDGFDPALAYRCTFFDTVDNDEGRWQAVTVETLDGDFTALLAALAEPNDQPGPNQVCTADMEFVPELWLENAAGEAMRAAWPRDACGKTKPATHDALEALAVSATETIPTVLITTREALDAGCAMTAGVPLDGTLLKIQSNFPVPPGGALPDPTGDSLPSVPVPPAPAGGSAGPASVCIYVVDAVQDDNGLDSIPGMESDALDQLETITITSGTFLKAGTLATDVAALLFDAASGAAPKATDCSIPPTRFAQVAAADGMPLTVELDGCIRLIPPSGSALVAPAEVVAALAAM